MTCPYAEEPDEMITTERIGLVTYTLAENRGRRYTTADLALLAGIAHNSTWRMLDKLSRVLPLCRDEYGWFFPEK